MGRESPASARTYRGMLPEQRRADRRQRLLTAALDVFTTHGYHTTRIEQLCSQAGVSTRNFYEEFASKEDVLLTLHDQINAAGLAMVTGAMETLSDDDDAETRVNHLLDAFWQAVNIDPRLPRLAYFEAPGATPAMHNQHQLWVNRWAALIETEAHKAAERGLAPKRDYRLIAIALVGAMTGLLREWQAHAQPRPGEEIRGAMGHMMIAAITMPDDESQPGGS
jgi:AcrR family transcriptional regulator